ncbi:hypothetical protein D3C81_1366550 [compost metagenome]
MIAEARAVFQVAVQLPAPHRPVHDAVLAIVIHFLGRQHAVVQDDVRQLPGGRALLQRMHGVADHKGGAGGLHEWICHLVALVHQEIIDVQADAPVMLDSIGAAKPAVGNIHLQAVAMAIDARTNTVPHGQERLDILLEQRPSFLVRLMRDKSLRLTNGRGESLLPDTIRQ